MKLIELLDDEDGEELAGSSPPLLMAVSPPMEAVLGEDDEIGSAVGMEVDPGVVVLVSKGEVTVGDVLGDIGDIGDVDVVIMTVVVVEDVRPPPGVSVDPPSPTDGLVTAADWSATTVEFARATAKTFTA